MSEDWVEKYHKQKQTGQAQKGGPGSGHWGHAGRPGKRGGSLPGDVAVSVETARREADAREVELDTEVMLYALHGMLHLLGLRDSTEAERAAMRNAERDELALLGVAPHWEADEE